MQVGQLKALNGTLYDAGKKPLPRVWAVDFARQNRIVFRTPRDDTDVCRVSPCRPTACAPVAIAALSLDHLYARADLFARNQGGPIGNHFRNRRPSIAKPGGTRRSAQDQRNEFSA